MLSFFCFASSQAAASSLMPRRVDAVRLLDEDMFAGLDGGMGVIGMELGGVGDEHHVGALDHALVAVEARRNNARRPPSTCSGFCVLRFLRLFCTRSMNRSQMATSRTPGSTFIALPAAPVHAAARADHADLDDVAAGGVGEAADIEAGRGGDTGGRGGGFEEITAGDVRGGRGDGDVLHRRQCYGRRGGGGLTAIN